MFYRKSNPEIPYPSPTLLTAGLHRSPNNLDNNLMFTKTYLFYILKIFEVNLWNGSVISQCGIHSYAFYMLFSVKPSIASFMLHFMPLSVLSRRPSWVSGDLARGWVDFIHLLQKGDLWRILLRNLCTFGFLETFSTVSEVVNIQVTESTWWA